MPNRHGVFEKNEVFCGYVVEAKLGSGAFGAVYKVSKDQKSYAMKVEVREEDVQGTIKMEVEILKNLQKRTGFASLIASGRTEMFNYMIMSLLGRSLSDLHKTFGCFDAKSWSRLGIQCLYLLKSLHDIGFLHRDVKPENFSTGLGREQGIVYCLDFGLARKFVETSDDGKFEFRVCRPSAGFRGTPLYASPNAHRLKDLGRCDDMLSMVYMVASWIGSLPWNGLEDGDSVLMMKEKTWIVILFDSAKAPGLLNPLMVQLLRKVEKNLKGSNYYSSPDYLSLALFFEEVMRRLNVKWVDPYPWEGKEEVKGRAVPRILENPKPFFSSSPWQHLAVPGRK